MDHDQHSLSEKINRDLSKPWLQVAGIGKSGSPEHFVQVGLAAGNICKEIEEIDEETGIVYCTEGPEVEARYLNLTVNTLPKDGGREVSLGILVPSWYARQLAADLLQCADWVDGLLENSEWPELELYHERVQRRMPE